MTRISLYKINFLLEDVNRFTVMWIVTLIAFNTKPSSKTTIVAFFVSVADLNSNIICVNQSCYIQWGFFGFTF